MPRWPWWVGGAIVLLVLLARFDYDVISSAFDRTKNTLWSGSTGTVAATSTPCFATSADADAYFGARYRHDADGEERALRSATYLNHGERVTQMYVGGSLGGEVEVFVNDGAHSGQTCWVNADAQFADITQPGVADPNCIDEAAVKRLLDDLHAFDASEDDGTRRRLLAGAHRQIATVEKTADCEESAVPDDFTLATAWAAADDVRLSHVTAARATDPCRLDAERADLASTWLMVYYHQNPTDRSTLDATVAAFRRSAGQLALKLPALTVDDHTAARFESDQTARADARQMGLPC